MKERFKATSTYLYGLLALIAIMLAPACNNDIFIDGTALDPETYVEIEGDGGEWSKSIPANGLLSYSVNLDFEDQKYLTYHGKNGAHADAGTAASELESIEYESPAAHYSIGISGKKLYINSYYNASQHDIEVTLWLNYDYDAKAIRLTIKKGSPLELAHFAYDDGYSYMEDVEKETYRTSFINNSSLTQQMIIKPFANARASIRFIVIQTWANGMAFDIPMFIYNGSEWQTKDARDMILGEGSLNVDIEYIDKKETIEVPANKRAVVTYTVYYNEAQKYGRLQLYNPITLQTNEVEVFCESTFPVRYEISIDYED